jgi:hypothetical protein
VSVREELARWQYEQFSDLEVSWEEYPQEKKDIIHRAFVEPFIEEFLAAHDWEVQANALTEAANEYERLGIALGLEPPSAPCVWLHARAAAIRSTETGEDNT